MPMIAKPSDGASFIAGILKDLDALDFRDALPLTRDLLAKWRATASGQRAPSVKTVSDHAYAQVYRGRLSADAAQAQVADAERAADLAAQHQRDAPWALAEQRTPLWNTFADEIEGWFPQAQQKFVETLATFEAAVAVLPDDVDGDSAAMKIGGDAMQAWSTARSSLETLDALHSICGTLRINSALSVAGGKQYAFGPREYGWREPNQVLQWSRIGAPHAVICMKMNIERGAQPALLSATDVEALAEADKRRFQEAERAQRQPRPTPVRTPIAAPVQEGR